MRRHLLLICILGLSLFTEACATKVEGLYVSDSFTASKIKSGPIVAGGVISPGGTLNRQDSNVYAAIMVREMQEERGYVTTEPVETMIQALGEQTYDAMLTTYASSGLDSNALGTIAGKLPKTQYVALAKIDADNAKVATERTDAKETKDEKGKVTKTPPRTTKRHMRTVLVTMHVYDLGSKSLVFSGQVSKSRENSKTYDVDLVSNARALVGAARGEDNDEAIYPAPEAPPTGEVLAEIFEGFAENFPKE